MVVGGGRVLFIEEIFRSFIAFGWIANIIPLFNNSTENFGILKVKNSTNRNEDVHRELEELHFMSSAT